MLDPALIGNSLLLLGAFAGTFLDFGMSTPNDDEIDPDGDSVRDEAGQSLSTDFIGTTGSDSLTDGDEGPRGYQLFGGDDTLSATLGDDTIMAGDGDDRIEGRGGDDLVDLGHGDDRIDGGDGNDNLRGRAGSDTLAGGSGADEIGAGSGSDSVSGGTGQDTLRGGTGDDLVEGGDGRDRLSGGEGNDTIAGYGADVSLTGTDGADTLFGGTGQDVLFLGAGDMAQGGDGRDTFRIDETVRGLEDDDQTGAADPVDDPLGAHGPVVIRDFELGADLLAMEYLGDGELGEIGIMPAENDADVSILYDGANVATVRGGAGLTIEDIMMIAV